ncbi:hypothetical protein, partial [Hyphomonas sp. ND6WE1B]|uniref:hypothetical protein n=1 Tax=Hyphomonas sp. ND6WE1B TaxID=1848191 RepID=UPI001F16D35B
CPLPVPPPPPPHAVNVSAKALAAATAAVLNRIPFTPKSTLWSFQYCRHLQQRQQTSHQKRDRGDNSINYWLKQENPSR